VLHPGNPGQLYGTTALDIVSDIMIIVLPFRLLFSLRVTTKQKIGLGIMFALGGIIIIFAILRATQVTSTGKSLLGKINFYWLGIWSQAESVSAVIVACLPQIWIWYKISSQPAQSSGQEFTTWSTRPAQQNTAVITDQACPPQEDRIDAGSIISGGHGSQVALAKEAMKQTAHD